MTTLPEDEGQIPCEDCLKGSVRSCGGGKEFVYPGLPETVSSGTCGPSTIIHSALHSQKCPSLHDELYGCPKYKWGCKECFSHLCLSGLRRDTIFFLNLSVCVMCVCVRVRVPGTRVP